MDRTSQFQILLLIATALAIVAVVFVVLDQRPSGVPPPVQEAESPEAGAGDPESAYIRTVTALSDSLHDRTELLALWAASAPDTAGFGARVDSLRGAVDRALVVVEEGAPILTLNEFDLVVGLYLDYLDVASLGEQPQTVRPDAARAYLAGLEASRAEIEGRLVQRLGVF